MSIKITKPRVLTGIALASVLFNFLTPLFTLVCSMTDRLTDWVEVRVSASGYAILGDEYYRLIDEVRPTLQAGVIIHIILSVIALFVLAFYLIRKRHNKWYEIAITGASAVLSLIYTVFGIHGSSRAGVAGHNLYSVTTYAYIPLIISCILGIAYFAVYNYLKDDFTIFLEKENKKQKN